MTTLETPHSSEPVTQERKDALRNNNWLLFPVLQMIVNDPEMLKIAIEAASNQDYNVDFEIYDQDTLPILETSGMKKLYLIMADFDGTGGSEQRVEFAGTDQNNNVRYSEKVKGFIPEFMRYFGLYDFFKNLKKVQDRQREMGLGDNVLWSFNTARGPDILYYLDKVGVKQNMPLFVENGSVALFPLEDGQPVGLPYKDNFWEILKARGYQVKEIEYKGNNYALVDLSTAPEDSVYTDIKNKLFENYRNYFPDPRKIEDLDYLPGLEYLSQTEGELEFSLFDDLDFTDPKIRIKIYFEIAFKKAAEEAGKSVEEYLIEIRNTSVTSFDSAASQGGERTDKITALMGFGDRELASLTHSENTFRRELILAEPLVMKHLKQIIEEVDPTLAWSGKGEYDQELYDSEGGIGPAEISLDPSYGGSKDTGARFVQKILPDLLEEDGVEINTFAAGNSGGESGDVSLIIQAGEGSLAPVLAQEIDSWKLKWHLKEYCNNPTNIAMLNKILEAYKLQPGQFLKRMKEMGKVPAALMLVLPNGQRILCLEEDEQVVFRPDEEITDPSYDITTIHLLERMQDQVGAYLEHHPLGNQETPFIPDSTYYRNYEQVCNKSGKRALARNTFKTMEYMGFIKLYSDGTAYTRESPNQEVDTPNYWIKYIYSELKKMVRNGANVYDLREEIALINVHLRRSPLLYEDRRFVYEAVSALLGVDLDFEG